ncbi:MAG TPA: Hsp20/alpha crystallin family protein [Candidatus Eisenbacteria bacterium]|nr:Hsp20/alpha crystallin family protein [Candidatus Eisenbacteria bacterium]
MFDLERRMDDLFRGFDLPALVGQRWPEVALRPFPPATDVFERDGDLVVRLELPGIDPEKDLSVALEEGRLVVAGERKQKTEVKREDYYRMESRYGSFRRHIPLPEGVDESKIKAEYKDGVLEVVVQGAAKAAPKAKGRAIPIAVEPGK